MGDAAVPGPLAACLPSCAGNDRANTPLTRPASRWQRPSSLYGSEGQSDDEFDTVARPVVYLDGALVPLHNTTNDR